MTDKDNPYRKVESLNELEDALELAEGVAVGAIYNASSLLRDHAEQPGSSDKLLVRQYMRDITEAKAALTAIRALDKTNGGR